MREGNLGALLIVRRGLAKGFTTDLRFKIFGLTIRALQLEIRFCSIITYKSPYGRVPFLLIFGYKKNADVVGEPWKEEAFK